MSVRVARRALLLGGLAAPALAQQPAFAPALWHDAWEAVLRARVDAAGRVDFAGIAAAPEPLRAVVTAAARADLDAMAPDARLAFLIDGYNALAMWGIVQRGIPERLDVFDRFGFFVRTQFRFAGRSISLKALEDDVIRAIGEERIHFALNCMVRGCPRLTRQAHRPATLEAQLAAAAREFCESGFQVRADPARRGVWLSQIFQFFTADFTPAKAPNLIAYVNLHRQEKLDERWTTRFFDYDWSINAQAAAG